MKLGISSVVLWGALWGVGVGAQEAGLKTVVAVMAYAIVLSSPVVAILVLRAGWKWVRAAPSGTLRYYLAEWRKQRRFHYQLEQYRQGAEAPFDPHIQHAIDLYKLTDDD